MLKLKRVEIHGFKSFFDRTELKFNGGGIAAIVGPNGCGKSNLSDAISWVLGEQSAKSLRGSRMEDVIFAGTRERKPLGMAAVTMTLVDPAVEAPHDVTSNVPTDLPQNGTSGHKKPSEVTITRRLYRSGESEYLVDGKHARLRDIQDLFMGTGLGPESYAIIEQGRIGQLLSSKPQDRRAVIEEAAGVTKYKTRRRLAEAKLESAKQNLSRVFDILEEVTRQLNSLKRQAAKAKRYGELKADMDVRLRVLLAGRFRRLQREAEAAGSGLEAASAALKDLSDQVAAREQEQGRLQTVCFETEARLTEARQKLAELNVEVERTRGRLEYQANQSTAIEQRIVRGEAETQELEGQLTVLEKDLHAHREGVAILEQQTAAARARSIETNEAREVLQTRLREREQALERGRLAVLKLLGEASNLKNQLAQIDEYLAGVERERARVTREDEQASADLERLGEAAEAVSRNLAAQQEQLESLQEQRRRSEEELALRKRAAQETHRQIDTLKGEASRLKARQDSLQEVISHRTYTTDSVKRLFGAIERGRAQDFQPLGVLADFVEVDAAYEKAAEEFLHDELEYVVVGDWLHAERGVDLMGTDLEGRATFLVHPEDGAPRPPHAGLPQPGDGTPGVVARLADCLRLVNGLKDKAERLLPKLSSCFIAADREAARRLAGEYPHLFFLLPDGICYHGCALSGGKKRGSGPLALKRELREVSGSVQAKLKELQTVTGRLEGLEHEIALLSEDVERLRGQQQATEKEALALGHESRKVNEELSRATSRHKIAQTELERLRHEHDRAVAQRHKNLQAIAEKEQARLAEEESLEMARQNMDELENEVTRAQEEHAVIRVQLAGLEERHRAEKNAISRLDGQWKERSNRRFQLSADIERMGAERARLLADNIELDRKAGLLAEQVLQTEGQVDRLASQESDGRTQLAAIEEQTRGLRVQLDEVRERRTQLEVELVRTQAELKFLDETSQNELNQPVIELAQADHVARAAATEQAPPEGESAPLADDAEAEAARLSEAEASYKELKARIEAMGPVNPNALAEFEETQQRYDFLSAQRQDLLDSIRDTEKAIQEIDTVSRQKFAEAFAAINANFRETFQILFGGGLGEMRLTDENNINESGIDIVASPPGKKLQNVLLLSGGEKALTALSLLMAIFRYQPSPFCVLDEVDAPLDEANIGRLTRLLKEMSHQTQFVLITHSKKTMESAEAMYGVTMQEPGVSKLVSVRFNGAVPPPPAPKAVLAKAT